MTETIIAVDPGMSGGVAVLYPDGKVAAEDMPSTMADVWVLFDNLAFNGNLPIRAVLENAGGYMPGNSGPASAKFARHCGNVEMALFAAHIPTETVAPGVWMRGIGVPKLKDKKDRKNWIKDYVQRRFPALKVTLKTADALGILVWATK
jgi:hypothetical protein